MTPDKLFVDVEVTQEFVEFYQRSRKRCFRRNIVRVLELSNNIQYF